MRHLADTITTEAQELAASAVGAGPVSSEFRQRTAKVLRSLCDLVDELSRRVSDNPCGPTRPDAHRRVMAEVPSDLPRRCRQVLEALMNGDSEKQVAARLGLSRHTVHIYVKHLYKHFGVNSRGELLSLWVRVDNPRPGGARRLGPGRGGTEPSFICSD